MSNAVFPSLPGLIYPVTKTPMWRTKIQESTSGKETRIGYWSYPRWKYEIGFDVLRSGALAELQQLAGFFNARQGSFDSFLFNDPDDNSVVSQPFGTGDNVTTSFQLVRAYGGYVEPVLALNGTPLIYRNGSVLLTAGTDYTISSSGLVTFSTAFATGIPLSWTGSYYWRCRFLDDQIDLTKFMKDLWELRSLQFQSVK